MSTREAVELGVRRRSRGRIAVVVLGIVALVLGIAAGVGVFVVPPILAGMPDEPFGADTPVVLHTGDDGSGTAASGEPMSPGTPSTPGTPGTPSAEAAMTASVTAGAGWTRIGIGPWLPADRAVLISPDGAYRAQLDLLDGEAATAAATAANPIPGDSAERLTDALAGAQWSEESLDSGCSVRYTTVTDGTDAVTVAIIAPPAGDGDGTARLILMGSVDSADADAFRTATADLVSSARFGAAVPTPAASPAPAATPTPATTPTPAADSAPAAAPAETSTP